MRSGKYRSARKSLNQTLERAGKFLVRRNPGALLALSSAVAGVLSLFKPAEAQAASYTWDSSGTTGIQAASGTWGTDAYWTTNGTTLEAWPGTGNTANFGGGPGTWAIDVSGNQTVSGITFNNTGYSLSGGTLTLASATITTNRSASIASVLDGSTGLTKAGTATLTLTGANTYTGSTVLSGGTLALSGGDNRLPAATTITFSASSTLDLGSTSQALLKLSVATGSTGTVTGSGGTLTLTANAFSMVPNTGSGAQTLNMSGLGTFIYNAPTQDFIVSGQYNNSGTGASASLTLAGDNTITAQSFAVGFAPAVASVPSLPNSGIVNLGQSNTINADTIYVGASSKTVGTLQFQSSLTSPTLTIRGTDTAGRAANMYVGLNSGGSSGTPAYSGTLDLTTGVSGASSLDAMVGTLNIARIAATTSARNITGIFTMGGGTLDATTILLTSDAAGSEIGSATGIFSVTGGTVKVGTLTMGNKTSTGSYTTFSSTFNLNGAATLYAQTIQRGADTSGGTKTRTFNWNDGTIRNYTDATDLTIGSGVTWNLAATGTHTFNIDAGRTATINAALVNATTGGTLVKAGSGTLTLTAANTYTGTTTVNAGKLIVNGSLANTAVAVNSGATLAGTGTLAGAVTIQSGGHLAPGNSPGALIINNTLTLTSGSVSDFEIASTSSYDQVTGLTGLSYGGTLNVTGTIASSAHTYTLFSLSSGTPSGDFSSVNLASAPTGYRWHDFDAGVGVDYFNNASGTIQLELGNSNSAAVKLGLVANALSSSLRSDTTDESDEDGMNALGTIHVTGSNGGFVSEIDGLTNENGVHDFADGYVQVDNDLSPAPTLVMLWLKDTNGLDTIQKSDVINYLKDNAGGAYTVLSSSDEAWQKLAGAYSGFDTIINFGSTMGTGDAFSWKFEGDYATITVDKVAVVPEPGSLGLLGLSALALMSGRRRKQTTTDQTTLGRFYARRRIA